MNNLNETHNTNNLNLYQLKIFIILHILTIVQRMKAIGESFLETQIKYSEKPVSSYSIKYGFHIPGANSVDHLHMHCIAGKQTRMFSFAGFATADNVIKGLEELPDGSPVCLFLDY
eukprot:TRINITY_DN3127_c0_g1_i7.p1 TRINITY_DN3127_c0_g1~~TRINITY_DN3127_c0_g1_i7.p1  ORF type:complete len:116 (-),score=12.86 TRINITY_DN3127_c0_g1_i7:157-504(-)